MTYTTLLLEMVVKMDGVMLREGFSNGIHKLHMFYDGTMFLYEFGADGEEVYKEAFHRLVKYGIKQLVFIESLTE